MVTTVRLRTLLRTLLLCITITVSTGSVEELVEDAGMVDLEESGGQVVVAGGTIVTLVTKAKNCIRKAAPGDNLSVHYTGRLDGPEGKIFDTSRKETGRTTRGCRDSLTSCRARSSPTRSRLRRPKRSPPSTLPSTGRPRTASPMPTSVPTPMSRPSPRTVLGLAAHPLDLCKWRRQERGRRALIYNARDHLPCSSPALSKSHPTLNPLLSHC